MALLSSGQDVESMSSEERREFLKSFLDDVFVPQRKRLLAYREHTNQSAQVDSDGYLAQMVAAIVLGVSGNLRRGKTGMHPGDLSDGTEIKGAYRAEQMNDKEDTHINFGAMSPKRTREFLDRERAAAVHSSYDVHGRFKMEILELNLRDPYVIAAFEALLDRSKADKPQLQPRLYPDGKRDRLQTRPGHFLDLGARLLARAVVVGDGVVIDKWDPEGLPLEECLDVYAGPVDDGSPHVIDDPRDPDEFFQNCMINHRRALVPYCDAARSSQNVGFGNLAQHLVSVVTGLPGIGSGARGYDLVDGSEIKLAMGRKGDALGTEDYPRLDLHNNVDGILAWPTLYPVRILCETYGLQVKVFEPDMAVFREQVQDYFSPGSNYEHSKNIQYHPPKTFESNTFRGKRSDDSPRLLECDVLYCAIEQPDGSCARC